MQAVMQKPFYTRIALLGVAWILTFAAIILVATLVVEPADAPFPITIAVIALIVGSLIYFIPHPWGLIFAILGGLICFLIASEGIGLTITSPESFFDFGFPLFLIPAGILLIGGGITGLVQHFQHKQSTGNSTLVAAIRGVFGVLAVLLVISAVLTAVNLGHASASDKEGAAYAKTVDDEFSSKDLSASPTGKIVIDNSDPYLHTFTIDDLDIDVKIGPGSHEVITLDNAQAGEYFFYCRVTGHEDMTGKLTVR